MSDEYNKPNGAGIKRIFNAAFCSVRGLRFAWKYESAFRQEVVLVALLLPSAIWLAESLVHFSILIMSLFMLLIIELVNSAIETLADRITLNQDILIGRAKDIGSAAVLMALLTGCFCPAGCMEVLLIRKGLFAAFRQRALH